MIHNHYKKPNLFLNMPGHYLSCFLLGNKAGVRIKYGLSFNTQTTYKQQSFINPSNCNEPECTTYGLLNRNF